MSRRHSTAAGWPLHVGMAVAGAAAVVASASTLAGLARAAGWVGWTPWLLPAALDVGSSAGGWCWLRRTAPPRAQAFGRAVALVGAGSTLAGNAAGHLIVSGYLAPSPLLVVIVGAVPAATLMALAHLAALVGADEASVSTGSQRRADLPVPQRRQHSPAAELETPPRGPAPSTQASATPPAAGTRSDVLAALVVQPASVAELVRATGRSRTTIVGHLDVLTEQGSVIRCPDKRYRLTTDTYAVQQNRQQDDRQGDDVSNEAPHASIAGTAAMNGARP